MRRLNPAGASALGLLDLAGNVREWCLDVYDPAFYARSPSRDPVNLAAPPGTEGPATRVNRGGDWSSIPYWLRNTYRNFTEPLFRSDTVGCRLCSAASGAR